MVKKKAGFYGRLKKKLRELGLSEDMPLIHSIIHRGQLCAQVLQMSHIMKVVVAIVNCIRARGLNHREFRHILEEVGSDFDDMLYFTAVRWLSRGNVLTRFISLKDVILEFLEAKDKHFPELKNDGWWQDLGFLTDACTFLNNFNLKLQGRGHNVVSLRDCVNFNAN